jgi:signal transduction histidine kinase
MSGPSDQQSEELARAYRELEEFVSEVAHDLRSPLFAISGFSQMLLEEYRDRLDPNAREYVTHIHAAVARMGRLVENLLTYSRVGLSQEPFQAVRLDDVLSEVRKNLDKAIRENQAEVRGEGLPSVRGSPTQLVQLFQNLAGNAIKFRRDVPPVVTLGARPEGNMWCVSVADNGIGIEARHLEKLFQFQRVRGGSEGSGLRIGLATAKKIVQRHGGRIWVESEVGQGTTFFLTLPAS